MIVGILEPRNFSPAALLKLESVGEVRLRKEHESVSSFIQPLNALFVRLGTYIGEELLQKAPMLQYLCSPTTGMNHVEMGALDKRNIQYISLKGETEFLADIRATPEHTFGLVLSLLRNYKSIYSSEQHEWNRNAYIGGELFRTKVGIIGMGRVGRLLAKYLKAFDAEVGYYDHVSTEQDIIGIKSFDNLESLLKSNEIILMCASYKDGQSPILKKEDLFLLKGKYLVNTARGELIDELALYNLAVENHFAGIALDVLTAETLPENRIADWAELSSSRYDIILTPHISGATLSSMHRTEVFIAQKLIEKCRSKNLVE